MLALVMIMTLVSIGGAEKTEAADDKVLAEEFAGYRRVTLGDFIWTKSGSAVTQITANSDFTINRIDGPAFYGSQYVEDATTYSLDHTYLDFDFKKSSLINQHNFNLFTKERANRGKDCIRINWNAENTINFTYMNSSGSGEGASQLANINLTNYGVSSPTEYFNIKIRADFAANASDSSKRDATLQYWINNRYVGQMNLVSVDLRNGFDAYCNNVAEHPALRQPTVTLDNAVESGFDTWTFRDANLGDQTVSGDVNWTKPEDGTESLDRSLFRGKINFKSSGWNDIPIMYFGGSPLSADSTSCGFRFRGNADNLAFDFISTNGSTQVFAKNFYGSTAGTAITNNPDMEIAISVNVLESSGGSATVAIGVFFDGKLYNNEYLIQSGIPESALARHIRFKTQGSSTVDITSYPAASLTEWTTGDIGVSDQTLADNQHLNLNLVPADAGSLDGTLFQARINFPASGFGNFMIGGSKDGSGYSGLLIRANGSDNLQLDYINSAGTTVNLLGTNKPKYFYQSKVSNTTLRGNDDLVFGLSVEVLTVADANGMVKARFGAYFDGELYENMFFTAAVPENILTKYIKWSYPSGSPVIASYPEQSSEIPVGGEDTTENAEMYMNASIGDTITAMFHAELKDGVAEQYDSIILRATLAGSRMVDISPEVKDGVYSFALTNIYSQQMTDSISASLIGVKDGLETALSNIDGISIAGYCDLLAQAFPSDAKLLGFMANMLSFGAECQKYVSYKTDALPVTGRAWVADNTTSAAPVSPVDNAELSVRDMNYSARIRSAGLNIAEKIKVFFKIYAEDTTGLTLHVSGAGMSDFEANISDLQGESNLYRADLERLNPTAYDSVITAELRKDGTVIHTVKYSVNTYCANKAADSALADLVTSIYNYGVSAYAYNNQ